MGDVAEGFYEDDEPVEDVVAAFERGDKGVTEKPTRGVQKYFTAPGVGLAPASPNEVPRELISRA